MDQLLCVSKARAGMVTMLAVMIVAMVTLLVTVTMLLLGVGTAKTSIVVEKSWQAKSLANACAEEALQALRDVNSYSGSGERSFIQGKCNFVVINAVTSAEVQAWGTIDNNIVRKVKVVVDTFNPVMNIASWQEVAEF